MTKTKNSDTFTVEVVAESPWTESDPWLATVYYWMPNRSGRKDYDKIRSRVARDYSKILGFFHPIRALGKKGAMGSLVSIDDLLPEHREMFEVAKAAEISRRGY